MNIITVTALSFLLAVGLVLAAAAACRTVWRNLGRRRGTFAAILFENAVDAAKRERNSTGWSGKRRRRAQQRYD